MPEVATVGETLSGVEFSSWLGVAVAPGTPRAVIDTLNRELRFILAEEDVKRRFADFGGVPVASTPDAMRERVEREIARWNRVVESRNIERQ
jgi:tripartite-type tricarboxylate transporter receptor subunit TctC